MSTPKPSLLTSRAILWVLAPLLLSGGVLWLSAQDPKPATPEVKVSELAEKLQTKDKALTQKEQELRTLQERLATLQTTLDRDRQDLQTREKVLQDAQAKLEKDRTRPEIDPKVIRTYEAMEPAAAAAAIKELDLKNAEMVVGILGAMPSKKVARIMEQFTQATPTDAKLAARILERIAITHEKDKPKAPGV